MSHTRDSISACNIKTVAKHKSDNYHLNTLKECVYRIARVAKKNEKINKLKPAETVEQKTGSNRVRETQSGGCQESMVERTFGLL